MANLTDFFSAAGDTASQINEVVFLNSDSDTLTLSDERVYLKGGVYETNMSLYPDAAITKIPDNTATWHPTAELWTEQGIVWDGTHFWVCGYTGNTSDKAYKYNAAGVYQSVNFNLGSQISSGASRGITWDGTYFWVINSANSVFKYNAAGAYQNVTFSTSSQTSETSDITWDGTYLWVLDRGSDAVYKYNTSGTYQNVSFSVNQMYYPTGMVWDGSSFWVTGEGRDYVYKYNASGVYTSTNFAPVENTPSGVAWDGSHIWVLGVSYGVKKYVDANGMAAYVYGTSGVGQIGEGKNYVRVK